MDYLSYNGGLLCPSPLQSSIVGALVPLKCTIMISEPFIDVPKPKAV